MADFVQKTVNKTAVRDLAVPIADVTSFDNLIEIVIDDNPSIHDDFRKILTPPAMNADIHLLRSSLFGATAASGGPAADATRRCGRRPVTCSNARKASWEASGSWAPRSGRTSRAAGTRRRAFVG